MLKKLRLSGNALKIIACVSMLIDHAGLMLFPKAFWMRCVGRLAFPIFAFLISEGCRYTKNKLRYFLSVFILGLLCQIVYFIAYPYDLYFGILITFSISILLIYSLQFMKRSFFYNSKAIVKILSVIIFALGVCLAYIFTENYKVDYGFIGCVLPLFAVVFDFDKIKGFEKLDNLYIRIIAFCIGLLIYYFTSAMQSLVVYCLLTIPLLLLYSGKRGKLKIKYLFYVFYPLHLGVLAVIAYII